MNPYHYQSTLDYQGDVSSFEKCPYYKLSEQSATKLTSVQKPRIRFQYTNTYKCGECGDGRIKIINIAKDLFKNKTHFHWYLFLEGEELSPTNDHDF